MYPGGSYHSNIRGLCSKEQNKLLYHHSVGISLCYVAIINYTGDKMLACSATVQIPIHR